MTKLTIKPKAVRSRKPKVPEAKKRLITALTHNWEFSTYSVDEIRKAVDNLLHDTMFWNELKAFRDHEATLIKMAK